MSVCQTPTNSRNFCPCKCHNIANVYAVTWRCRDCECALQKDKNARIEVLYQEIKRQIVELLNLVKKDSEMFEKRIHDLEVAVRKHYSWK